MSEDKTKEIKVPGAPGTSEAASAPASGVADASRTNDRAEETGTTKPVPEKRKSNVWPWVRDLGIAVIVAILILQFIKPTIVKEHSMEPTLYGNDYVFLSKQSYTLFGDMKHEDIIVFKSNQEEANGKRRNLIKRIIGLPGDTITVSGGEVYRNGQILDEPYIKDGYTNGEVDNLAVEDGTIFVMGDNRINSLDSRDSRIGLVSTDDIVGKAVFRIFPFNEIGTLE